MWEPATEIEQRMRDSLRGGRQEEYFRILARLELLLPVSDDDAATPGSGSWATWAAEDRTHILAFTSHEAMRACLHSHAGAFRSIRFTTLADSWPDQDWWLAVNPGLPIEGYLPAWFVGQVATGDASLPDVADDNPAQQPPMPTEPPAAEPPASDPYGSPPSRNGASPVHDSGLPARDGASGLPARDSGLSGGLPSRDSGLPAREPAWNRTDTSGEPPRYGETASGYPDPGYPDTRGAGGFIPPATEPSTSFSGSYDPAPEPGYSEPPRSFDTSPSSYDPAPSSFDTTPDSYQRPADQYAAEPSPAPGASSFDTGSSFGTQPGSYDPGPSSFDTTPSSASSFDTRPAASTGFDPDPQPTSGAYDSLPSREQASYDPIPTREPAADPLPSRDDPLPSYDQPSSPAWTSATDYGPPAGASPEPEPTAPAAPAGPAPQWPSQEEVEDKLAAAAAEGDSSRFLETLMRSWAYVPIPPEGDEFARPGDGGFRWHTDLIEGEYTVTAFTTPVRLTARYGGLRYVKTTFARLTQQWPGVEYSLYVNPGTEVGANMPGPQVTTFVAWARSKGLLSEALEVEQAEQAAYAAEHAVVPELMQKVIPHHQVSMILERGYDRVAGFVHRYSDVADLATPEQLYRGLGLLRDGNGFALTDDAVHVISWVGHRTDLYQIAYGGNDPEMAQRNGGWIVEPPPFVGDGYAANEDGRRIPEYKVDSVRLPHGARIYRLTADGSSAEVASYDSDRREWIGSHVASSWDGGSYQQEQQHV